jgi:exonuclease VII small subunit
MALAPSLGEVLGSPVESELEDYDFRRATYEALLRSSNCGEHALDAAFEALDAAHRRLKRAHMALKSARQPGAPAPAFH